MKTLLYKTLIATICSLLLATTANAADSGEYKFAAGDKSLQGWLMPDAPPYPEGNEPTPARVELGKKLFFDPRLSGDGNMSCATCHSPLFGWSDGLPTAKGVKSMVLGRASPTVINTAYNSLQMWDGRKKSLEDQAMGPMLANVEMNMNIPKLMNYLQTQPVYKAGFEKAFGEQASEVTVAKAIASFERTIISTDSPFDQWIKGDNAAMTKQQVEGFKLFVDADKANCAACHSAPNFTDDGFHNVGLASWGNKNPDMGRYAQKPIGIMKGAFKTPTLRDITLTAPYFHDGSAATLNDVVDHYAKGGVVKTNLSPNMKQVSLSDTEQQAIVAFLTTLTKEHDNFVMPKLPPQIYARGND